MLLRFRIELPRLSIRRQFLISFWHEAKFFQYGSFHARCRKSLSSTKNVAKDFHSNMLGYRKSFAANGKECGTNFEISWLREMKNSTFGLFAKRFSDLETLADGACLQLVLSISSLLCVVLLRTTNIWKQINASEMRLRAKNDLNFLNLADLHGTRTEFS